MNRWGVLVSVGIPLIGMGCARKPDAMGLLQKNRDAMFALKAYRADCFTELIYDPPRPGHKFEVASLTAEKPNKMRYDTQRVAALPAATDRVQFSGTTNETFACDGQIEYLQFGKSYRTETRPSPNRMGTILEPWEGFYNKEGSIAGLAEQTKAQGGTVEASYQGVSDIEGTSCDKVKLHKISTYEGSSLEETATYFIGQSDHLVRRVESHISFDGKPGFARNATLRNIDTHPKIDPSIYAYVPPVGVVLESSIKRPTLLAAGKTAPNFTAFDTNNKPIKLADLRGSVVVLDFWASWCGPCVESMPHTQDVANSLSNAGGHIPVIFLAVDDGEPRGGFDDWVSTKASKFPNLRFAYADPKAGVSSTLYHVSGIPTQYIIDRKGIIRSSFVGYGGPTDDLMDAIVAARGR